MKERDNTFHEEEKERTDGWTRAREDITGHERTDQIIIAYYYMLSFSDIDCED